MVEFLSTPSVGRATDTSGAVVYRYFISIHALRGEGDLLGKQSLLAQVISIHALRGEGDATQACDTRQTIQFLSTPSVGRATGGATVPPLYLYISIHALRGEGDL